MAEEEDDRPAGRRGWRLAAMLMRAAASASETIASTGQELSQSETAAQRKGRVKMPSPQTCA
jgi:hypothetical protein